MSEIAKNIETIRQNIGANVTIVAASKTRSIEEIQEAKDAGIEYFGENRVQEFLDKYGKIDVCWHFIGRLQTNKVKYIVGKVALIHSVDSIKLLEEIEKAAAKLNVVQNILIEVSVAGEEQKGGIDEYDLSKLIDCAKDCKHVRLCGLMMMPPLSVNPEANDIFYLKIKNLYDRIVEEGKVDCRSFKTLSVGMSNDYVQAVKFGSNTVRIGSAIFGKRNPR